MPDVRPYRALTFDRERVGDLALAVAEPYDKVTEAMRAAYLKGCPYNVTRVDLPREELDGKDRYATAAGVYRGWVDKGVVRREEKPALYLYEQDFQLPGRPPLTRRAFIGLVEAREHAKGHVLPHERTFREPKADRMALLEAVRAHFGLCFLLYDDKGREVERALAEADIPTAQAIADFKLADGTAHRLTPITDPAAIAAVRKAMATRTCTIADGHHRYETAIAFRREHEKKGDMKPGYAYRQAAFVDIDDEGLTILPTHRLLPKGITVERVIEAAKPWFEASRPVEKAGAGHEPLTIVGADNHGIPLRPRRDLDLARELPDVPPAVRHLQVTLLHKLILERGLGIEAGAKEHALGYIRWEREGLEKLRSGAHGSMAVLAAPRAADVLAVAESGAVMPQKSTDFYPKLLSGLVMNDIEDELHG
jgi:uncharacterized protein (DUF1015 family)